jgi:predicted lysophospholipase L1 biosynthesis ABC-type transport system permease subunit
VVGRAVFPRLSRGSFDGTGLGVGAQVAPGPLPIEDAEAIIEDAGFDRALFLHDDGRTYAFVAVALAGDQPGLEAELAELADESFSRTLGSLEPTTIRDLDRVRDVPAALAGVLALVAVTALAYQLSSSVRERRRELALLRTLGFSSGQLRRTIVSHGLLLATIAVAIGVPLGLALGRVTWRAFAARLHVEGAAPVPWPWLAGAVPVAVAVAGALSLVPAIRAGRLRPAAALRDEVRA